MGPAVSMCVPRPGTNRLPGTTTGGGGRNRTAAPGSAVRCPHHSATPSTAGTARHARGRLSLSGAPCERSDRRRPSCRDAHGGQRPERRHRAPRERGVAEREHAAVDGRERVAVAGRVRQHADDGLVEGLAAH